MSDVYVDMRDVQETAGKHMHFIGPVDGFPDGGTGGKVAMMTTGLDVLVTRDTPDSLSSRGDTVGKPHSKYCWGALYLSPTDGVSRIVLQCADTGDLEYFDPE